MEFEKKEVTSTTQLSLYELATGGFLIQISPDDNLPIPTVTPDKYEAESSINTLSSGLTINNTNTNYTSGTQINYLGEGRSVTFNKVKADADGEYMLTICGATSELRYVLLKVNGSLVKDSVMFKGNSSYDMDGASWVRIPVQLKAGSANTITIQSYANGWGPNLDYITIQPIFTAEATGIREIDAPQPSTNSCDKTYNLLGMPVNEEKHLSKGIYIKNGKKIYIK